MEPNTMVILIALIFALLFIADRIAAVLKERKREEESTSRAQEETKRFIDMTGKAVNTITALHGGITGEAVRGYVDAEPTPDWKAPSNGTAAYAPNRQPAGPPAHRATEATSR